MHRPLASCSTLCAALAALALLAACSPGGHADPGVPRAPHGPVPAASAPGDATLAQDLERLERAARAKPAAHGSHRHVPGFQRLDRSRHAGAARHLERLQIAPEPLAEDGEVPDLDLHRLLS